MTGEQEWDAMMAWLADQTGQHAALARDHLLRIELMRDGIKARDSDVHELRKELAAHNETLRVIGIVLDVAGRAARDEATAHQLMEVAVDTASFRNLMAGMYGLGPLGMPLPAKRTRKAAAAA